MRISIGLMATCLLASPAMAAPPAKPPVSELPAELTSPATRDSRGRRMQVMSRAFLDLPVGELQAAAQGRTATAAERKMTVRDLGRRQDPNFEQNLQRQIANSGPAMQASANALKKALPAMMSAMSGAMEELERASTNLPSPTYPKK